MTVLAIETATAVCAAAIASGGKLRSEKKLDLPHVHSEKLIALIEGALDDARVEPQDVDGIAVSIGPGSFTGLRIGLSVAKGLASAWSKPIVAVPTLEALAYSALSLFRATGGEFIVPMIDARRNDVYAAVYRVKNGIPEERSPSQALPLEEFGDFIRDADTVLVVGDGAVKCREFLTKSNSRQDSRVLFPADGKSSCSASTVAFIGEHMLKDGRRADLESLEPLYVKEFHTLVQTQH
jgi:tRNA threonylcarbamoyladenosine biosynthesis protein TsaB